MATIDSILGDFEVIHNVANNGVQLSKLTKKTIANIDTLVTMYSSGVSDPAWAAYMESIAGVEGVQLTLDIYNVLLDTQQKLKDLGV